MESLNDQLNLRARHPDFQQFLDFNENESQRIRQQYTCHLNQKYGEHALQAIDVFPASVPDSPVFVFIHGGYWRALDKRSYSFVAEPFVQNGFTVCVLNYRLIPEVDLKTLIEDVQNGLKWIQAQIHQFNGNPHAMSLAGHSAGGHLALMSYLLEEDLRSSIRSICSISGLFDLAPIRKSYLNEVLQLSIQDIEAYSPLHIDLSVIKCPTLISVGAEESAIFIEQSKELFTQNKNNPAFSYFEGQELNHYNIVHLLGQIENPLTDFLLDHGKSP